MASKLYPTLSAFYKAGNIGFGSEHDAMLCGVPEEKLYRKPSRRRGELPLENPYPNRQLDNLAQDNERTGSHNANRNIQESAMPQTQPEHESTTPPLTPSAPPLLEMLDMRLQQYLNVLLTSNNNTALPANDSQTNASALPATSDSEVGSHHATVTLPLPPNVVVEDSWLDEIQPDYDDLTSEEVADEILNNLNMVREEDTKDHEKQKSLSLLRMSKDSQEDTCKVGEKKDSQVPQYHYPHQEDQRHRHSHHKQPSQGSRDDNEDIDDNFHRQQYHHHHRSKQQQSNHHHKSHDAVGLQERDRQSRDDLRLAGKTKQEGAKKLSSGASKELYGKDRKREVAYPHRRTHQNVSRNRYETGQPITDPVDGHRESGKLSPRRKTSREEKENRNKSPERPGVHGENSDYNAWMTWRKQVNRQLATIILLKQQGKEVSVQTTDMRRKPLRQSSIDFVSQIATQSGSTTSLGGKPYVMYGIPRASLLPKSESTEIKKDS